MIWTKEKHPSDRSARAQFRFRTPNCRHSFWLVQDPKQWLESSFVKPKQIRTINNSDLSPEGFSLFDKEEISSPQLIHVEINTLSLPYAELNKTKAKQCLGHDIQKINPDGSAWRWAVRPDPEFGMPTALTMRVLFGLTHLACQQRLSDGTLPRTVQIGSLNNFCKMIGLPAKQSKRALIKKHIKILICTLCKSKQAFKRRGGEAESFTGFRYLTSAAFIGETDSDGNKIDHNFVVFDEIYRKNLEQHFIKSIDLTFLKLLKSPTAQLLYTHISNLFYRKSEVAEADYEFLATRMGLTVYSQLKRAKQQLNKHLDELVNHNYLSKYEWEKTPKAIKIRFYAGVRYTYGEVIPREKRKELAVQKRAETTKQLTLPFKPSVASKRTEYSEEEKKETILIREAARINMGRRPNLEALRNNGWTIDEAYKKADEIKSMPS